MAKISLRAYNREIETMINEGQMQEAIAHCRHILKLYPKHVETYRLLGKAFLESNQYTNASDIFQRVLSANPDDFVSLIGMSLIREDEGDIEGATLHMERAFEKQPYNSAIQDELRRLYGKRDGMEPPKVRLTQGALARMYLKGNLTKQGISELRSALAKEPTRVDLQSLLTQAYAETGQKTKALEVASTILTDFPHNLTANRILAEMLSDDEHPKVMKACRRRLYNLSPCEMYISEHATSLEDVPDRAVTLEQLDWVATREELDETPKETQADWAASLGVELESEDEEEALPDWLSETGEEEAITEEESFPPSEDEAEQEDEEFIPSWMQEAGWEASTGEAHESEVDWDSYEAEKDELAPADIPDWLKEQAPSQVNEIEEDVDMDEELIEKDTAWLNELEEEDKELPELAEAMEDTEPDEIPDWMNEMDEAQEPPTAKEEELPDWLKEETEEAEVAEEPEKVMPPIVEDESVPATEREEDLPAWLDGLGEEEIEEPEVTEEPEEVMPPTVEDEPVPATEREEGFPAWLDELGEEEIEEPEVTEEPEEVMPPTVEAEPVPAAESEEDLPAWMDDFEEAEEDTQETAMTWLADLDEEPKESEEIEEPEEAIPPMPEAEPAAALEEPEMTEEPEAPGMPDLDDEDATMAWLESLAAKQGVPDEELVTSIEDRSRAKAPLVEEEEGEEPEVAEEPKEAVFPTAEEETEAPEEEEEMPAWLDELGEEAEEAVPPISEAEPATALEEPELTEEPEAPGMLDLDDEDAAMAWLESLAEKRGVPDEELVTDAEERSRAKAPRVEKEEEREEPEVVEEPKEAVFPTAEEETEAPEEEEEMPAWLDDVEEEEEPQETIIGWLSDYQKKDSAEATTEDKTEKDAPPAKPDMMEEDPTMAWLKDMAHKQDLLPEKPTAPTQPQEEEIKPPALASEKATPTEEEEDEEYAWIPSTSETPAEKEKIDLNTASLSKIEDLNDIGFRVAEGIVSHREEHGHFESIENILDVAEVDADTLETLKEQIEVISPPKAEEDKAPLPEPLPEPEDEYQAALFGARGALASGEIEDALKHHEKLIEEKELLEEVIADLSEATYKYPMNVSILKTLGDAYMQVDKLQEALDAYSKAEDLLR
ncbi:MAG: ComE operon protein 1 [Chloroflexi bacterium]|nr:ComE operon protein 1 [Chloroflexota bacterium]